MVACGHMLYGELDNNKMVYVGPSNQWLFYVVDNDDMRNLISGMLKAKTTIKPRNNEIHLSDFAYQFLKNCFQTSDHFE